MSSVAAESLRQLPSVESILLALPLAELIAAHGRARVTRWARNSIAQLRSELAAGNGAPGREELAQKAVRLVRDAANSESTARLAHVVNATGIVLHTNLGRAPLADRAIEAIQQAARYCNLEMDLDAGARRYRGYQLDGLWRELTGAEASLVVNNCASATLIALQALARGRKVIVSRGELIEIGGSYRLPDVFAESGAVLCEVGTTNRTRLSDYETAIGLDTAGLLKAHQSNYRVVGFTEQVGIIELAELAHRRGVIAIDDIGSGCLYDLRAYGLPPEPTIADSLAAGADLVLFSGDKLFGGPQCGILLGRKVLVERVKKSPLARAVRVDKLTLAALQATLEIHLAERAFEEIPVLRQLAMPEYLLKERAERLAGELNLPHDVIVVEAQSSESAVGGGSLPTAALATWALAIRSARISASECAWRLRTGTAHVIARIEDNLVLLDLRTVLPCEEPELLAAIRALADV